MSRLLDIFGNIKVAEVIPGSRLTTTTTSSALDISTYAGTAMFYLTSGAGGAGATMDAKLMECATSDGSYADIAGATFTQVGNAANGGEGIELLLDGRMKYIKAVAFVAGTATFDMALIMIATKQILP